MERHINLFAFEQKHPYLERFRTNQGLVYLMNLQRVGILHNMEELTHIMQLLANQLELDYYDGRVYSIRAEKDKIIIKPKF